jgi:hypothetical protein
LVAGRDKVYGFDGSTWADISSLAGYLAIGVDQELDWTGCLMGQFPVINNPQTHPEYWGGAVAPLSPPSLGLTLQPLPWVAGVSDWASVNKQARVIRSHKTFMFALNLIDGGTEEPDAYRWSHPADINGLPPSWDDTDPLYLAGKANLGSDSGAIIDGRSLRDSFAIYSEDGINILDYDPNSEFVWRRRELSSVAGLLSKNCIAEVKGRHYFLADGDIAVNDGNQITSILHNRLRKFLSPRISADYYLRSFVMRNNPFSEIWFCVPIDGAEFPNAAMVYNFLDDSWAIRDLPSDTIELSHGWYGSQSQPALTWDTWVGDWNTQTRIWGSTVRSPLDDTIIGVDRASYQLVELDPQDERVTELGTTIERLGFPLEGHDDVTTITRIYPHIEGTQPITIQIGSQDRAGGPVRWKPAKTFTPGTDRKIDVRTTGELHAWRISSVGFGNWSMSGMTLEFEPGPKR